MHRLRLFAMAACALLMVVSPRQASGKGTLLELGPDYFCIDHAPQRVAFSPPPFTYLFGGICNLRHTRLQIPVDVPWTGTGTYDPATGKVTEDINIPAPTISQPSRPYGRFLAYMHCPSDPWRDPNVKCDQVAASSKPSASDYPPGPYGDYARSVVLQITSHIQGYRRPYTARMKDTHRQYLNAQYKAYVTAMNKQQLIQKGAVQSEASGASGAADVYRTLLHPSVLSPRPGQILLSQTAVPIKLAAPNGWTVTGYTVTIQRRDAKGAWVNHVTIPVSEAEARSPAGYKGFGNGAPPAFLVTPGRWRLNAQVSVPKKSGVSDWVEFNVTPHQDAYQDSAQTKKRNPFLNP